MKRNLPEIPPGSLRLPLYVSPISAGFPSPADDHLELSLDLSKHLIDNPHSTFCVKVRGNSMEGAMIRDGDILIVDRSKKATTGRIVIAFLDGEFIVKRIFFTDKGIFLKAEHPAFDTIKIREDADFQIWGVVTWTIHQAR